MGLKSIFSRKNTSPTSWPTSIHYACGKNIFEGWLNADGFDVSYPDGTIDQGMAENIFQMDLVKPHPFPDDHFRFGYSEDFLEHLTQAESLVFLSECYRTLAPGGILRCSFPGLRGILRRHFNSTRYEDVAQGVNDAYTLWHHAHFYSEESIDLVARHLGFSDVTVCAYGQSAHAELQGRDTRPDQADLNLVVELTK